MRASNTVSACLGTTPFPSVTRSIAIQTSSGSAVRTNSMHLTRPMVTRALEVRPLTLKSNEGSLKKAVAAITERIKNAKSVVALPAFTLSRVGLQKEVREAIEGLGCPFATTSMEKSIIDESHSQFAGMYSGVLSAEETRKIVEGAELVLDIGGVSFNDETTMGFSTDLDPARFISIGLNDVRVGDQLFGNVRIADTLAALAKFKSVAPRYKRTPEDNPSITGKPSDKIE